jgi:hypothetical protein
VAGPEVLTHCAAMGVAHWDEVDFHRRAKGEMDASWQWLGPAAGTRGAAAVPSRTATLRRRR